LREEGYSLPAILMSGYDEGWLEDAARQWGVFARFVKPFPLKPFLDACLQAHEKHSGSRFKGRSEREPATPILPDTDLGCDASVQHLRGEYG
jgi:hypothetical protein